MNTAFSFTKSMKGNAMAVEVIYSPRMLAKSATLLWNSIVLRFPTRFNTSVMNIPSSSHMVKTTFIQSIITVIFVKEEEMQAVGFTAVQFVTIQPIQIVLLMHAHI
ncbi:hypothetical protein Gotur_020076 [Gossypium turneri]